MEEYLPYLVIVGGWLPYLYVKYLWKNLGMYPVTTTDIDFGFFESTAALPVSEPIYSRFSKLHYQEKHLRMDRMFPVVPVLENTGKTARLLIEFITTPEVGEDYVERLVGRQILVNRLEKFDILFKDNIQVKLVNRKASPHRSYLVNVPSPYIFLFHKAITFTDRENEEKKSKDIYYIYYILRFHPRKELLFRNLKELGLHEEKKQVLNNLKEFFSRVTSRGCLIVEQENGPDDYIDDVRQDAFDRFRELIDVLNS